MNACAMFRFDAHTASAPPLQANAAALRTDTQPNRQAIELIASSPIALLCLSSSLVFRFNWMRFALPAIAPCKRRRFWLQIGRLKHEFNI